MFFKFTAVLYHLILSKLGDEIQDFYKKTFGKVATSDMLTHLQRDTAQAIWRLLLDDDLMRAYREGEAMKLFDDIIRAMFPRFLFYSTDYPEKRAYFFIYSKRLIIYHDSRVLMSCIKFLGSCLCPRCTSLKTKVPMVGSKTDMRNRVKLARFDSEARQFDIELARKLMFKSGVNITSKKITRILDPTSAVPTRVCISFQSSDQLSYFYIECLLRASFQTWVQFFSIVYCGFPSRD
jgi:hypothetical protein